MKERKEDYVCPGCGTNVANLAKWSDMEQLSLIIPEIVPMPTSVRVTRNEVTTLYVPVEEVKEPLFERMRAAFNEWRQRHAFKRLAPAYQHLFKALGCAPIPDTRDEEGRPVCRHCGCIVWSPLGIKTRDCGHH